MARTWATSTPASALAWRETTSVPGQRLWLWRRGDTTRLADEGFDLTGMRFTGRTLRWLHGADRTAPPPPASVCPGHAGAGSTTAVDIISTATATVACWRATGASAAFAAAPRAVVAAGSWVAVQSGNIIAVRSLLDPGAATRGVEAPSIDGLTVDEHGSLAWTFRSTAYTGGHPPDYLANTPAVWVDDAAGTHALGTTLIWDTITLSRDGSALRWSGEASLGATTLVPR